MITWSVCERVGSPWPHTDGAAVEMELYSQETRGIAQAKCLENLLDRWDYSVSFSLSIYRYTSALHFNGQRQSEQSSVLLPC
jgi:hypothetical protein